MFEFSQLWRHKNFQYCNYQADFFLNTKTENCKDSSYYIHFF